MKVFKLGEYLRMENSTPGKIFRAEILTKGHQATDLGGIFGLLPPGSSSRYHYHKKRESIIIAISGEVTKIIEGEQFPIKAGDIIYIPAGKKHMTVNRSDKDFRYLEFFTCPPVRADFVEVK